MKPEVVNKAKGPERLMRYGLLAFAIPAVNNIHASAFN